jgi:hypothetical protein
VSSAAGGRAPAVCHGLRCRCNELQGRKRGETEGDGRDTGEEEPERSGSVPRILRDGANPHLHGIFARERLRSRRSPSKQPWERIRSAPLRSRGSPTKHTVREYPFSPLETRALTYYVTLLYLHCFRSSIILRGYLV